MDANEYLGIFYPRWLANRTFIRENQTTLDKNAGEMPLVKQSIISISTPTPKVPIEQLSLDEPLEEITFKEQRCLVKQLQLNEPIYPTQTDTVGFTNTSGSGWRVSDILREIRLDNFEMSGLD